MTSDYFNIFSNKFKYIDIDDYDDLDDIKDIINIYFTSLNNEYQNHNQKKYGYNKNTILDNNNFKALKDVVNIFGDSILNKNIKK